MRTFIDSVQANNLLAVDTAISNKTWLSFASHGTASVGGEAPDIAFISALLDYIISKGVSVQVVTFKYLYDAFGSTKLEQRIKLLEG
jgi:hypothetical protein